MSLIELKNARLMTDQILVFAGLHVQIPPGIVAVTGDEGVGKTTLLRLLAGHLTPDMGERTGKKAFFWPYAAHDADQQTVAARWAQVAAFAPDWNQPLCDHLCHALAMTAHRQKALFMLSKGSRRKVDLIANLAAGAQVTCIDQPYVALDAPSIAVLRGFLDEASETSQRTERAWVVADYEADPHLAWDKTIHLTR